MSTQFTAAETYPIPNIYNRLGDAYYGSDILDFETEHQSAWTWHYFGELRVPSAEGGFSREVYAEGIRKCRVCAAAVLVDSETDIESLNKHRAWHDLVEGT